MFGISLNTIAFMLSMGFATAALLYVVLFDRIERERNASRPRTDGELTQVEAVDPETGATRVEYRRDGRRIGHEDPEAGMSVME